MTTKKSTTNVKFLRKPKNFTPDYTKITTQNTIVKNSKLLQTGQNN